MSGALTTPRWLIGSITAVILTVTEEGRRDALGVSALEFVPLTWHGGCGGRTLAAIEMHHQGYITAIVIKLIHVPGCETP